VLPTSVVADMMIVRGLDYYTGTVFETIVPEHREIGSICGGGRYENLASNYTEQKLPGVGGSIGLTRLFYILQNYGLVEASSIKPVDVCLVPFSAAEFATAEELAEKLRKDGRRVDIAMTDKRLGDKMRMRFGWASLWLKTLRPEKLRSCNLLSRVSKGDLSGSLFGFYCFMAYGMTLWYTYCLVRLLFPEAGIKHTFNISPIPSVAKSGGAKLIELKRRQTSGDLAGAARVAV